MESRNGTSAVFMRLIPVLQVILYMAQLVMSGYQVNVVDVRALFDSRRDENTAVNNKQGSGNFKQQKR